MERFIPLYQKLKYGTMFDIWDETSQIKRVWNFKIISFLQSKLFFWLYFDVIIPMVFDKIGQS